jgi:hypothetical protein
MARNVAFSELVLQLRAELRRSQDPAVGVEDLASLKQTINHICQIVAHKRDWPFLHRKFPRVTLNAGQRYYDLPDGLDQERVTFFKLKYGGSFYELRQGVEFDDYQIWDPEDDERADPVLKFDFVDVDGATQIEVWPLPASEQYLYLEGYQTVDPLVNDDDVCPLDDAVVVLFAAAELMLSVNKEEAAAKRDLANDLLNQKAVRGARNASAPVQIGVGTGVEQFDTGRAVIRITGT